jgi:CheY-like chemotaxis protein
MHTHLSDERLESAAGGNGADDKIQQPTFEELKAAKVAAEAASAAKDHFISVLSHELRGPLTPALAEMSFMEMQSNLSPQMQGRVGMVRRNLETAARLLDDLLDLTRISRGKVSLHFEAVDVHETIRAAISLLQNQIDGKVLEVALKLQARSHYVWGDPMRLQQVFHNVLSNAVKFTPENGMIGVRTLNDDNDQLLIEFRDSGVGIDADMLGRIFNTFEQAGDGRRFGGLGLGLSIARSLVELHQGVIRAASEGRDQGAVFTIELKSIEFKNPPPAPISQEAGESSCRILLVEDHGDTRCVLKRLLESIGHTVHSACSVSEGLAMAERVAFDLLLSDIGLPDGTGNQLLEQLKIAKQFRAIAFSGFGQEEDVHHSRRVGFDAYLIKPIQFGLLKRTIQDVMTTAPV